MDPRTRLYLEDPDLLEFDATVVEIRPQDGDDVGVVLDRSAFYPTSGGQPHDTGTLGGEPVLEVMETPDGAVVHRMRRAPAASRVHGAVDAARRRDHMQQHSGQHLLSATCVALYGRETVSFHLGSDRCTIDLAGAPLDAAALAALERRTNEIVWEARPVRARFLAPAEHAALRKAAPAGVESVRVIEIEGWDLNACCGTHVRSTSEIGLVKLLGQEKWGGAARLAFACGYRALAASSLAQSRFDALVRTLTCGPDEIVERCEKLLQESKQLRRGNEKLMAEQARGRAAAALAAAPRVGGTPVVVLELETGGAALRETAAALVASGAVALVGARGDRAELLFARPEGVSLDLRPAMERAAAAVGGRGGGPAARVQGAGPGIEALSGALAAAMDTVSRQLEDGTPFDRSAPGA